MRVLIGNAVEVKPEIRRPIALFRSAQVGGNVLFGPLQVVGDEQVSHHHLQFHGSEESPWAEASRQSPSQE